MRIGDKVRFLNQTGGGIIVGFGKKGWVTVQDEDGFEFPIPEKECVVIGVNDRIEIWSKDMWENFFDENSENLSDIAENLFTSSIDLDL